MYEIYFQQIANDRINEARKIAAAHHLVKTAGATAPNRATGIATRATRWLATVAHLKIGRVVGHSNAY